MGRVGSGAERLKRRGRHPLGGMGAARCDAGLGGIRAPHARIRRFGRVQVYAETPDAQTRVSP